MHYPIQKYVIFNSRNLISILLTVIIIISVAGINIVSASDTIASKKGLIFRGGYQYGKVFGLYNTTLYKTNATFNIDNIQAFSAEALWQTNGYNLWEHNYNFPSYGIGIWTANFYESPILGNPIAIYGVFNAPYIRGKKWKWNYEVQLGLAFNWDEFHPYLNKDNIAIGHDMSGYVEIGSGMEYSISNHLSLELGVYINHFSNGSLKLPNLGINSFSPKFSIRYEPGESKFLEKSYSKEIKDSKYEIQFQAYGGAKNIIYTANDIDSITKYKGVYYPVAGVSSLFNRKLGEISKIGLGICFGYIGFANHNIIRQGEVLYKENASFNNGFELSLYPSYELVVNRLSCLIQIGGYLYRKQSENMLPVIYQRAGIKYQLSDNLFAGISLRISKFNRIEYIEWNIGYRLNL